MFDQRGDTICGLEVSVRPSQFVSIRQRIDNVQGDFPHVPVSDGAAGISVELDILTQVSVQELGLDEDSLSGEVLEPTVLDLDDVRVMRTLYGIDAV
jgi:hypothetical protein